MDADKVYEQQLIHQERLRDAAFCNGSSTTNLAPACALNSLPARIVIRTHDSSDMPSSASIIHYSDLTLNEVAKGSQCRVMVVSAPKRSAVVGSKKLTLPYVVMQVEVADRLAPGSQAVQLELYNVYAHYTEIQLQDVFPLGSSLAIKSPFLTLCAYTPIKVLQVHHPSDIEFDASDTTSDEASAKQRGAQAFREGRFHAALRDWQSIRSKDKEMQTALNLNIAAVLIELQQFEEAVRYCDDVLAVGFNAKARYRKAVALYGLRDFLHPYLETFYKDETMKANESTPPPLYNLLARLKVRMREARGGFDIQDWTRILDEAQHKVRLDVGDYTSPYIEKRAVPGAGLGLFAKATLRVGDLIMVSKADALQLPSEARLSDVPVVDLVDEIVYTTQSPDLLGTLAHAAHYASHKRTQLSQLYAGEQYDRTAQATLSSHRLRKVLQYNAFSLDDSELELGVCAKQRSPTPEQGARGFYHNPSYFNHSCLNNCSRSFLGDLMVIKANRQISKGEELTLGYVHRFQSLAQRQEAFSDFGFTCACTLCKLEMDEQRQFPDIVKQRAEVLSNWRARLAPLQSKLLELIQVTETCIADLCKTYQASNRTEHQYALVVPYDVLVSAHMARQESSAAEERLHEMLRLRAGVYDDFTLGLANSLLILRYKQLDLSLSIEEQIQSIATAMRETLLDLSRAWRCRGLVDGMPGFIRAFGPMLLKAGVEQGSAMGPVLMRGFLWLEKERKLETMALASLSLDES